MSPAQSASARACKALGYACHSKIKIITQGQTELAQLKKAFIQTIVAKKREEVRDDLREAGDTARDSHGGYAEAPNFPSSWKQ